MVSRAMYIRKSHKMPEARALDIVKHYGRMAVLATQIDGDIRIDQVPLFYEDGILRGHLARANPASRDLKNGQKALVTFLGADAYISPHLYPSLKTDGKVVPTWLYKRVDVRGRLRLYEDRDSLLDIADKITAKHEARQDQPWTTGDAPPDFIERMLGGIVGIDITIDSIIGKAKLDQGESDANKSGVIQGLSQSSDGGAKAIADAMRKLQT